MEQKWVWGYEVFLPTTKCSMPFSKTRNQQRHIKWSGTENCPLGLLFNLFKVLWKQNWKTSSTVSWRCLHRLLALHAQLIKYNNAVIQYAERKQTWEHKCKDKARKGKENEFRTSKKIQKSSRTSIWRGGFPDTISQWYSRILLSSLLSMPLRVTVSLGWTTLSCPVIALGGLSSTSENTREKGDIFKLTIIMVTGIIAPVILSKAKQVSNRRRQEEGHETEACLRISSSKKGESWTTRLN